MMTEFDQSTSLQSPLPGRRVLEDSTAEQILPHLGLPLGVRYREGALAHRSSNNLFERCLNLLLTRVAYNPILPPQAEEFSL